MHANARSNISQELPGDLGRYGRRWLIRVPAYTCLEGRAGLCPRVLVSADDSLFVSEFMTSNTTSDSLREELWSAGDSLTGTDPTVISSRWIEGWRGCEQQVCSGTALYVYCSLAFVIAARSVVGSNCVDRGVGELFVARYSTNNIVRLSPTCPPSTRCEILALNILAHQFGVEIPKSVSLLLALNSRFLASRLLTPPKV